MKADEKNSYSTIYDNKETYNRLKITSKDNWCENENYSHLKKGPPSSPIYKRNEFNYVQRVSNDEIIVTDTLRIYCTEDTPTFVSPFSSQSNLSALSVLSFCDDDSNFQDQQRYPYGKRTNSQESSGGSNPNSDSSDNDYSYDEDTPHLHRIDVSPFDSQINLANLSLLCIEEENEDEDEEEEKEKQGKTINETGKLKKCDSYPDDENENCDFSEAERRVFEECVNSGVSKLTRRILHVNGDN